MLSGTGGNVKEASPSGGGEGLARDDSVKELPIVNVPQPEAGVMSDLRVLVVHAADGIDRIVSALETEGCDVTAAHTAATGVAKAVSGAFDCLVAAHDLPGDDGLALLDALAESRVDLPTVMVADEAGVSAAAYDRGADRVVRRDGAGTADQLASEAVTVSARAGIAQPQQDVSGHEPTPAEIERAISESPIGISLCDPDLPDYPLVYVNGAWERHTGYEREEVLGRNPRFLQGPETDPAVVDRLGEAIGEENPVTVEVRNYRRDGTPFWNELTIAPVYDDGELVHYVGFQNDVTDRKMAEQLAEERAEQIAAEREALDRVLGRVNGLLNEISRILVEGEDGEAASRRICEKIAEEPGYAGGWIGEVSKSTGRLEITASSGVGVDGEASFDLESVPAAVERAEETDDVHGCAPGEATTRSLAPDDIDARKLLVVPITYGHHRYGLLGIYSSEADALDRREQKMCESLGKMIANGLHSLETTRMLTTDRVIELCVDIADEEFTFSQIADAIGGQITHLGTTRLDDDGCELYFTTHVTHFDRDPVERLPFVASLRVVSETDDDVTFAVTTTESPPFARLAEHGGVVDAATAESSTASLTVEVPPEQNVRSILDVFRSEYDGVTLHSRVERENRDRSLTEFAAAVDGRLTDRQRSALKTAALNGYFEWPRPVDGDEIASQMGITRQTFHQHLRAAERKLVEAYVDP